MSDETVEVLESSAPEQVVEQVQEVVPEVPKVSVFEEKAIEKGWKPKEQFEGNPEEWRPAKEWLERGELLDAIHSLKRESKEHKEVIKHLSEQSKKIEEITYKKAVDDLKKQIAAASEIGDANRVLDLTDQMADLKSQQAHAPVPDVTTNEIDPELISFANRNQEWFNKANSTNVALFNFATARDEELRVQYPHLSLKQRLDLVEKEVSNVRARMNPNTVTVPKSVEKSPVAAPSTEAKPEKTKVRVSDLPPFHQEMVKKLQRTIPSFKIDEYVDQLRKLGEI